MGSVSTLRRLPSLELIQESMEEKGWDGRKGVKRNKREEMGREGRKEKEWKVREEGSERY